jgi:DNA-directed RNA polymerase subunit RPC12/RpoP
MVQRRRRGFIILFGTRSMIGDDREARPVNAVCPRCGQRADIVGKTYRTWFTIFFIPIFPVGGVKRFSQCSRCGAQFPGRSADAGERGGGVGARAVAARDHALHSLRNSPGNSITLKRADDGLRNDE